MNQQKNIRTPQDKSWSEQSEMHVIGSIVFDSDKTVPICSKLITPKMFYSPKYSTIYSACLEISQKAKVDFINLREYLSSLGDLQFEVEVELSAIMAKAVSAANVRNSALIIREKWALREGRVRIAKISNLIDRGCKVDDFISEVNALSDQTRTVFSIESSRFFEGEETARIAKEVVSRILNPRKEGLRTGIKGIDQYVKTILPGTLTTIAARTGVGKTAMATTIAANMMSKKIKVGFISLEMCAEDIIMRLMTAMTNYTKMDFFKGEFLKDDVLNAIECSKLFAISDSTSTDIGHIKSVVRDMTKKGCEVIFIDYVQLITSGSFRRDAQSHTDVSNSLHDLAKEFQVPVIALAQINRAAMHSVDKVPRIHHIKDSDGIAAASDHVIIIHRPEVHGIASFDDGMPTDGKAVIIVEKNRSGMTNPIGTICDYESSLTVFKDHVGFEPQPSYQRQDERNYEQPHGDTDGQAF